MANIDSRGNSSAPAAMAVFVPPQRRAPPRRPAPAPLVIDVHPGFPAPPPPRPSIARTLVRPAQRRSVSGFVLAGALLLTALAAAIAFRAPIVSAIPQLNGVFSAIGLPVNLLGIEIHDITATRFWSGGWEQLRIEGVIVNVEDRPVTVPVVQLTIKGADGAILRQWEQAFATDGELAAGTTLPFTTDFPEPPEGAANVVVRFAAGTAENIATPRAANIEVRFGDGTVQTVPAPGATNTTVRFGNAMIHTIGTP